MHQGYSVLLGEFIGSELIQYGDCEPLQVVCPACNEPLFKSVRTVSPTKLHYLSHYKKSESYEADCELRVSRMNKEVTNSHNSESRNQRLDIFLAAFTDLLAKDPFLTYERGLECSHSEFTKAKTYRDIRTFFYDYTLSQKLAESDDVIASADQYIGEMESYGSVPKTDFSISIQQRIARDMLRCLYSEKQRPNFSFLYGHAILVLVSKFSNGMHEVNSVQGRMIEFIREQVERLMSGNENQAQQAVGAMRAMQIGPPFTTSSMPVTSFFMVETSYEMIGTLLRLPYFELMRKHLDNQKQRNM